MRYGAGMTYKAWYDVKSLIVSAPILAHYKSTKVFQIQCDSSQSGIGVALMQNGYPIAYSSRALTETESRYTQIEKEMLAIIFSVEKFNRRLVSSVGRAPVC